MEQRLKVEARINQLEGGNRYRVSGTGKEAAKFNKYESKEKYFNIKQLLIIQWLLLKNENLLKKSGMEFLAQYRFIT